MAFSCAMQKTIKKPQEKDFFQSTGHKSVLKKERKNFPTFRLDGGPVFFLFCYLIT